VIRTERLKASGDPVRGIPTPFLQSFNTIRPITISPHPADPSSQTSTGIHPTAPSDTSLLNHFLRTTDLSNSLTRSESLSAPLHRPSLRNTSDPQREKDATRQHKLEHDTAAEAMQRLTSLTNASSADRTRANIQRCIETFGRHNTDSYLRPKPVSTSPRGSDLLNAEAAQGSDLITNTPRVGPDTGSSEVQIAILTAKINTLADFLETRGRKDKVNARNLRLLVHRRQKLLRYLRKKERGGERWKHLIETLGLTEATWMGEISM